MHYRRVSVLCVLNACVHQPACAQETSDKTSFNSFLPPDKVWEKAISADKDTENIFIWNWNIWAEMATISQNVLVFARPEHSRNSECLPSYHYKH